MPDHDLPCLGPETLAALFAPAAAPHVALGPMRWLTHLLRPAHVAVINAGGSAHGDLLEILGRDAAAGPRVAIVPEVPAANVHDPIDLLVIDGASGAATSVAAWRTGLAEDAVVLVIGLPTTKPDGAGDSWSRLADGCMAVRLDQGVGMLAVGRVVPPPVAWLASLPPESAALMRAVFRAAGEAPGIAAADAGDPQGAPAATLEDARLRAAYAEARTRALEAQVADLNRTVENMRTSSSWRITAPLRFLVGVQIKARLKAVTLRVLHRVPGGEALLRARADLLHRVRQGGDHARELERARDAFRIRTNADLRALLDGDDRVTLPAAHRPRVSIILVLWNQAALTLACLRGLATEDMLPVEVVIVDNASTDETGALLERVDGARVIRNAENVGFLKAVNQAVPEATGEHVLLLNNDAIMRPGSLLAAVRTLESDPSIGAVGGRIVLPNGRLQEAGSIIWRDGSCLGYARGLAPEAGEAMFRRDVDYCSGALLLFRRQTFHDLGGFDETFAPAYYEEADFCMRLRAAGLRVVYEPLAVIDHFEFGSAGKSERAIALQRRNQDRFRAKHAAILDARHEAPDPARVPWARHRLPAQAQRVLIIDDRVPLPHLGAGYPRAWTLLQAVVESGRFVTFYPLTMPTEDWSETYAWLPREVEVAMGHGRPGLADFLRARKDYYDIVIVSRPHNMQTVRALLRSAPDLRPGGLMIYDAEAVFAMRDLHKARAVDGSAAAVARAEAMIADELSLTQGMDRVVSVSESEAARFRSAGPADVRVLGHSLRPKPSPGAFSERDGLLFVGLLKDEDSPNVDSLLWFHREVLPLFEARLEQVVSVLVAGRNDAPSVRALRGKGLTLLGRVADLTHLYDKARVFIAPTRYAGGIPHKVHEAAAHGLPVVATPLLAEQLGWRDGDDLLVGGTPEAFADQIARLYTDEALWDTVRANALRRIETECDPAAFRSKVRAILDNPRDRP